MHSTDHHLNNPTIVDTLGVAADIDLEKTMPLVALTQSEYDRMADPDPYTCYLVTEPERKMYLGRNEIKSQLFEYEYAISPSKVQKGVWDILRITNGVVSYTDSCKDLSTAVSILHQYISQGSAGSLKDRLYTAVENYIRYHIRLDEAIIGIIIAFGIPKDDPELQKLMSWLVMKEDRRSNQKMERQLDFLAEKIPGGIASLYRRIYGWFLINEFFIGQSRVSEDEPLNIGDELNELCHVYNKWRLIG